MARLGRKGLFRVHAWIGLNLGFLLFVACFSGTVAVFSAELSWLADPSLRVEPPAGGGRETVSWQAMHDRVAAAYPQALVVSLAAPHGERFAARAAIAYSPTDIRWVLIDPYTGALQGHKSGFNLVSFFRIFHKQLYIVPSVFGVHGTLIVGVLAVLLLAGTLTGLLSGKRWWRAFVRLRRGKSRQLFWSDLHRLAGVWALVVTIILCLTGIWYLAERVLLDAGAMVEETPPERLDAGGLRHRPAVLAPLDLDRAVALAQAAYPALDITQIMLPARPDDPLVFSGQAEAWLVRDRANQVQMDPYSGEILGIRRAAALGPFERWVETADPLHFGTFAGLAGRVVWFAAGLSLCAGILAGLYSGWLRRGRRPERGRRLTAAAATVPTLLLMAASGYGAWAFGGEALRSAQRPVAVTPLAQDRLGPWQLSVVRLDDPAAPPGQVRVSVRFTGGGRPNFERAVYWIGDAGDSENARPAGRFVDRLLAGGTCPRPAAAGQCRLHLTLTQWDGAEHSISVDLRPHSAAASSLPIAAGLGAGEGVVIAAFALCLALPLLGWMQLRRKD